MYTVNRQGEVGGVKQRGSIERERGGGQGKERERGITRAGERKHDKNRGGYNEQRERER